MTLPEFKNLIVSHPDQLGDRQAYTDLQKKAIELSKVPSKEKKDFIDLLCQLVNSNSFSEFNKEQIAGLVNFVNDSGFDFDNSKFASQLKAYLENHFLNVEELLKRAFLIKLVVIANPYEYSPAEFERNEGLLIKIYPWLYADILVNTRNIPSLSRYVIGLFYNASERQINFVQLMNHMEVWLRSGLLNKVHEQVSRMLFEIVSYFKDENLNKSFIERLNKWMLVNGFIFGEPRPTVRMQIRFDEIRQRMNSAPLRMELAE